MTLYEKYKKLNIDTTLIGLEKGSWAGDYFCTPKGVTVIGWENSIHYCFIKGYGEMVFAVNPETCVDKYVYPLAENFEEFLRLILACGSTTAIEQIIGWTKEQFIEFVNSSDNAFVSNQAEILQKIKDELKLDPMEDPYEYVRNIQANFDDSKIEYTDEYYDTLGLENPNHQSNKNENHGNFEVIGFMFKEKK